MAHLVETMFASGEAPWHRLGVRVEHELTSKDAIERAGLDWHVQTSPLLAAVQTGVHAGETAQALIVPGHQAVVRARDLRVLGVVGSRYRPIQNAEAFRFFDQVVGEGHATYHTAGSLDGGKRIWILARLRGEVRLGVHDVVEKYLLLASSHDGSNALRMIPTPVRVVCSNTLNLALQDRLDDGISIRHTATAPTRMEQAMRVLRVAHSYFNEFELEAERLLASRFTDRQMQALAVGLYPDRAGEPSPRGRKAREQLLTLFSDGIGHREHGITGTAWAAINAVAEHVDHHRGVRVGTHGTKAEARLSSSWFGSGAALKRDALRLIDQQLLAA